MKILVVIERSPKQYFLVRLTEKRLISEIKKLLNKRKHSKAIVTALSKGRFERTLTHHELPSANASLILTEHNASCESLNPT